MRLKLFLFLFVGVALIGCKKNQLKKPTDVSFKLTINKDLSSNGKLVFTSGTFWLSEFDVAGTRQEGDPIAFSKSFPGGLAINFSSNAISELDFDIPQGVYTNLEVEFDALESSGGISLVVNGTYVNNSMTNIPVRFEFMSAETFAIEGEDYAGSSTIVLDKDVPLSALIELDPIYWFDIVPANMLENATLTDVEGTMTLLINENVNEDIYDLLADRVDESAEAVFQ